MITLSESSIFSTLKNSVALLALYVLALWRIGYVFGSGDQSETLPLALHEQNTTLYKNDFYVSTMANRDWHERSIFTKALAQIAEMDWADSVFLIHALSALLLFGGLFRLGSLFGLKNPWRLGAIFVAIVLLDGINLGGNELYYNVLSPSYLAQVLGLWVIVFCVEESFILAAFALTLASFLHLLIGTQLWLLCISACFFWWRMAPMRVSNLQIAFAVFGVLCSGSWCVAILQGQGTSSVSSAAIHEVLAFRAPHHYLPQSFSALGWLVLLPLWVFAWYFFNMPTSEKKEQTEANVQPFFKYFYFTAFIGLGIFALNELTIQNATVLSTQWFSTTIWLKTVAVFAVFAWVSSLIPADWSRWLLWFWLVLGVSAIVAMVSMQPEKRVFKQKNYDLPFFSTETQPEHAEIEIAQMCERKTPINALFLTPTNVTAFRYYSKRASWVDFKTIAHAPAALNEWYRRIRVLYRVDIATRNARQDPATVANQHFAAFREDDFRLLTQQTGATHLLTTISHHLKFPIVAMNERWVVYRLR